MYSCCADRQTLKCGGRDGSPRNFEWNEIARGGDGAFAKKNKIVLKWNEAAHGLQTVQSSVDNSTKSCDICQTSFQAQLFIEYSRAESSQEWSHDTYSEEIGPLHQILRYFGRLGMADIRLIYDWQTADSDIKWHTTDTRLICGWHTADIRLTCARYTAENWNLSHHK